MQKLDYNDIINFMGRYTDKGTEPVIKFEPIADERIVFSNYTARYQSGMVTKAPIIYSSVANEGGSLSPYPVHHVERGPNQTAANLITEEILCGAANSSILRATDDLVTYRYQYAGNWTNQDPLPWMGAFHSSDLVMLFGSYGTGEGPVTQPLEGETSAKMGELVLSFMEDPYNGPPGMGWPQFDPTAKNGGTMLRFGADGKVMQEVNANKVQAVCFGKGPYNPFP
jgi:carboxylesterase type B